MKRPAAWVAVAVLSLAANPVRSDDVTVEVGHNRLSPTDVTISVGEAVTFHNLDKMPGGHSLVADDGSFSSPALEKDEMWSHIFEKAGTYPYHIREHPSAKGKITVE